jgi:pimeloyl-ACP methyl ester carboxylesterase
MGGMIAQDLIVKHPDLVRRLVLTGTGPRGRLEERTVDRDKDITLKALRTQLKAIQKFGRSAPADLSTFTQPTLIANGDHDRMVPTVLSEDLHRRIQGSQLIIYPNSGHGGIFQFHEEFAPVAAEFLAS